MANERGENGSGAVQVSRSAVDSKRPAEGGDLSSPIEPTTYTREGVPSA